MLPGSLLLLLLLLLHATMNTRRRITSAPSTHKMDPAAQLSHVSRSFLLLTADHQPLIDMLRNAAVFAVFSAKYNITTRVIVTSVDCLSP